MEAGSNEKALLHLSIKGQTIHPSLIGVADTVKLTRMNLLDPIQVTSLDQLEHESIRCPGSKDSEIDENKGGGGEKTMHAIQLRGGVGSRE